MTPREERLESGPRRGRLGPRRHRRRGDRAGDGGRRGHARAIGRSCSNATTSPRGRRAGARSWSTAGVRYLAQGQIGLVREALHERGRLLRNAPHLVHDRAFLVPAYSWWERPYYAAGLWALRPARGRARVGAGRGRSAGTRRCGWPRRWSRTGCAAGSSTRTASSTTRGSRSPSLRTIDDHGGTALNCVRVDRAREGPGGRVTGVEARDAETGEAFAVAARAVVNATGVFADEVRRLDEPGRGADDRAEPGGAPRARPQVPAGRDGRPRARGPTTAGSCSRSPGTTGWSSARPTRPSIGPRSNPRRRGEEVDFLLTHAGRYLATTRARPTS